MEKKTAILFIIVTISMPVYAHSIPVTTSTITALDVVFVEECPCSEAPETTPKGNGEKLTLSKYYIS